MPRKILETLFIASFVAALSLPLPIMVLASNDAFIRDAGEVPSPKPAWPKNLRSWLELPAQFKPYFAERFGFREDLIRWNASLHRSVLGVSVSRQVVVGLDNWLYFTADQSIEDFRASIPLSDTELDGLATAVRQWRLFLDRRGIPLLIVICPNKSTIYPEHMPSRITRVGQESRLDQLMHRFRQMKGLDVLDLRPALIEARNWGPQLYPLTESHWNEYGAFVGYREIATRLSPFFPSLAIPTIDDYKISVGQTTGGDLARLLGLPAIHDLLIELKPTQAPRMRTIATGHMPRPHSSALMEYLTTERADAPIPRAVVFRDSFGATLIPYLSEMFGHVEYRFTKVFDFELVDRECPDVVIFEMVERSIMTWWRPELAPLTEVKPPTPSSCFCQKIGASELPDCRKGGKAASNPADPNRLAITRATWGALPDGPSIDITDALAAQVGADNTLSISATVPTLGEPAPNHPKTLSVEYTIAGVAKSKTATEGQSLTLPADDR